MITLQIKEDNFLEWYFYSGYDDEQVAIRLDLADKIIGELMVSSRAIITTQELLDDIDFEILPMSIIIGYEDKEGCIGDQPEFDEQEIDIELV